MIVNAEQLVDRLNREGIVELPEMLDDGTLEECRAFVDSELQARGARYFALVNADQRCESPLAAAAEKIGLARLLHQVCSLGHSASVADNSSVYSVLRVLTGSTGLHQSHLYHYDASVVTALMPLYIPEGEAERAGELIVVPNLRPFRRSVTMNIVAKLFWQNPITRKLLAKPAIRNRLGARLIELKPGSLYFFWGYRTLHGNLPCDTTSLRATAIFHFGDPHAGSLATSAVLAVRKYRENLNSRRPAA